MLFACPATDDFFRSRMPWQEIEARVAQVFSRKGRAGVAMPDLDLFGEQVQRDAVSSNAGRPRVSFPVSWMWQWWVFSLARIVQTDTTFVE